MTNIPNRSISHHEPYWEILRHYFSLVDSDLWVRGCSLLAVVFKSRLVALSFWCFSCFWCFWYGASDTFDDLHFPFSITESFQFPTVLLSAFLLFAKTETSIFWRLAIRPTARNHGWPRGSFPQCVVGRRRLPSLGRSSPRPEKALRCPMFFAAKSRRAAKFFRPLKGFPLLLKEKNLAEFVSKVILKDGEMGQIRH